MTGSGGAVTGLRQRPPAENRLVTAQRDRNHHIFAAALIGEILIKLSTRKSRSTSLRPRIVSWAFVATSIRYDGKNRSFFFLAFEGFHLTQCDNIGNGPAATSERGFVKQKQP